MHNLHYTYNLWFLGGLGHLRPFVYNHLHYNMYYGYCKHLIFLIMSRHTAIKSLFPVLWFVFGKWVHNQNYLWQPEPLRRNESGRFWRFKIWFNPPFLLKCLYQVRVITVFTVFRLLTDFVCLYTYEFWISLCKIVRSSVILLLPLSL